MPGESRDVGAGASLHPGVPGTRFDFLWVVEATDSTNADLLEAAQGRAVNPSEPPPGPDSGRVDIAGAMSAPQQGPVRDARSAVDHYGRPGTVLIAGHQRRGRGRQGRQWLDRPGSSLLCSALIEADPSWASLVPLAAGLAIVDGLDAEFGVDAGLKWPNDVLVPSAGERKLCGILAEARSIGGALIVVVGFGINLDLGRDTGRNNTGLGAGVEPLGGAIDLRSLKGVDVDRFHVARAVLAQLDQRLETLAGGGREKILSDYRDACLTIGRHLRFHRIMEDGTATITGVARGIDDDGALVIGEGDTAVTLTAGDAHHLGPAPAEAEGHG